MKNQTGNQTNWGINERNWKPNHEDIIEDQISKELTVHHDCLYFEKKRKKKKEMIKNRFLYHIYDALDYFKW